MIFAFLCWGCVETESPGPLRFWTPIEPEADSIMAEFEIDMHTWRNLGSPRDSALIARVFEIADSIDSDQLRARAEYFSSVVLNNGSMTVGDAKKVKRALELTDSAQYPYDVARFHRALTITYPRAVRSLIHLHCADVFKSVGDSSSYAGICNQLAVDLEGIGDTINSLKYFDESIRIYNEIGTPQVAFAPVFNRLLYINRRWPEKCRPIVDSLMADSFTQANIYRAPSLLSVAYELDGNPAHLRRGYAISQRPGMAPVFRTMFEIELASHFMKEGNLDSMQYYRDLFNSHYNENKGAELHIWKLNAKLLDALGKPDSAQMERDKFEDLSQTQRIKASVARMESSRLEYELEQKTKAYEAEIAAEKRNVRFSIIAAAVIILIIGGGLWAGIVLHGRKEKEGEEVDTVAKLRAAITSDMDWTDVERLFAELAPEWTSRLKERWPDLTPGEVRMACLSYLGLDTKHMARILSIAPDSVKKNRQRLRAKLEINSSTTLQEVLARL